jgi:glycosyltransferase involved in cell wall biosynthesis
VVAFTSPDSDPRVRREAGALSAAGHEVTVFALREPGEPRRRRLDSLEVVGIRCPHRQGSRNLVYVLQYLLFLVSASWSMVADHLRRRFELVHVHSLPDFLVFAAAPLKLVWRVPVILDLHELMPELYASKFGVSERNWRIRFIAWVERCSIAFADHTVAVHAPHRETLIARGIPAAELTVVLNSPDTELFPPAAALHAAPPEGPIKVVYHGTMARRHGLDVGLLALAEARKEVPNLQLHLIGDGEEAPRLQRLIADLELGDSVRFSRGFIPVEELLPLLVGAHIGLIPLRADPFTRHMLPSKLLEYVVLGIPAICTDLPVVRRYFDEDAIRYVPSGDPAALARALVELAANPDERASRAEYALRFQEQHGWAKERERLVAVAEELLRRRRHRGLDIEGTDE